MKTLSIATRLMAISLALALSACGGGTISTAGNVNPPDEQAPAQDAPNQEPAPTPDVIVDVNAQTASSIVWDAPITDDAGAQLSLWQIGGYKIYQGTTIDNLSLVHDTESADTTEYPVPGLSPGKYYYAISTYDTNGVESSYSEVVELNVI